MAQFDVNEGNVKWAVKNIVDALGQGRYSLGEVLLAQTEALGRTVVSSCDTPVAALQMIEVVNSHLTNTIKAGFISRGFNMEGN